MTVEFNKAVVHFNMTVSEATSGCKAAEATCGCCERKNPPCGLRELLPGWVDGMGLPPIMCSDCFRTWYSGGLTDPEEIKRVVLHRTTHPEPDHLEIQLYPGVGTTHSQHTGEEARWRRCPAGTGEAVL